MRSLRCILALTLLAVLSVSAQARVTVERITYRGWPDSYRLTAGQYSLVLVPAIGGRIMEYSCDGHNVFWENPSEFGRSYPITKDWHNYGGSRTWVSPQESWGWPPSPMIDYAKANVEVLQSPKGLPILKVTGSPDIDAGVVLTKEITLDETGEVVLKQRVHNISGKVLVHGVWDVTQVQTPCFVTFPTKAKSRFTDGISYITAESRNSKQISFRDDFCIVKYLGEMGKIGSDSDGPWMIWFQNNLAYVKVFDKMVKGAEYPDGGCSVQVFTTDAKLGYVEMEVMGPLDKLDAGAYTELTEKWRLFRLSQPVKDENWIIKSIKGMRGRAWIQQVL